MVEMITTSIAPTTWDEVGGPGSIAPFASSVVVRQTAETHQVIWKWLRDLRHTLREREKAGIAMPNPSTAPATIVLMQMTTKDSPVTYEQQQDTVQQAIALVTSTIEPDNWKVGSDRYIVHVGTSIVVRHEPATLRKVVRLLTSLGFCNLQGGAGGGFF